MINTDTLNLLRLNSVSPHQPGDRSTHARTHMRTHMKHTQTQACTHIVLTGLDCQLAYSWEMVAMVTPDVASEGLAAVYFQLLAFFPCDTLHSVSNTAQSHGRGLSPDYASTPNYASITLHPLWKAMIYTGRETSLPVSQDQTLEDRTKGVGSVSGHQSKWIVHSQNVFLKCPVSFLCVCVTRVLHGAYRCMRPVHVRTCTCIATNHRAQLHVADNEVVGLIPEWYQSLTFTLLPSFTFGPSFISPGRFTPNTSLPWGQVALSFLFPPSWWACITSEV